MGLCVSSESAPVETAKLVLEDGQLQEFSYPIQVSFLLSKDPAFFICNSDDLAFDDVVFAMSNDEELQPGQLYFALPLNKLKRKLQAEEMAALAVKASAALMKSGAGGCGWEKNNVAPVVSSGDLGGRRRRNGGGRGKVFAANLSTISE